MAENETIVYNINKDYRIVSLKGNKCTLFFKNCKNKLIATLDGCNGIFTKISTDQNNDLTKLEKGYILSFVRAKKYSISKEVASFLQVSIIKYLDGREEYLSEKMLRKRIEKGIDFAKVYIGKLVAGSVYIKDDTSNCSYDFSNAEVSKIVIGTNCALNIDLRDNPYIESIQIKEYFSGSVNLSRSNVESIFIGNNCRCNLSISNAKKCFNLQVADIYSGNMNITNCCMYALSIGYYSYADIVLTNNLIKKDIVIGDSFRGSFCAFDQNTDMVKIGDDCKGTVKTNNSSNATGCKKILIGDDFAGVINLNNDECIRSVEVGQKFCGRLDALYANLLQKIKFGKYYSGNADLSFSRIENLFTDYGACGAFVVNNCANLEFIQATVDNKLIIDSDSKISKTKINAYIIYYTFNNDKYSYKNIPFYKRVYRSIYSRLME